MCPLRVRDVLSLISEDATVLYSFSKYTHQVYLINYHMEMISVKQEFKPIILLLVLNSTSNF